MSVVTLISDWGLRDHYLAAFKGRLISSISNITLCDISHTIAPFDVLQASFILKNAYGYFPKGTVHFSGINGKQPAGAPDELLIVESNGHYFVGSDSGLFSLVLDEGDFKAYALTDCGSFNTAKWAESVSGCIGRLVSQHPSEFAEPRQGMTKLLSPQPMVDADSIKATVIYIDEFENLVLNVKQDLFEQVRNNRRFVLEMRRRSVQPLQKISNWYNAVEEGEIVALFNHDGYLEIALNRSNASGLLGINLYDNIRIAFQ